MRIGMIAPLVESVPPRRYGGTERVVSVLTEELVRRGHDVTLFASGDSRTSATLVPCSSRSLRSDPTQDTVVHSLISMGEAYARACDLDILHNHNDYLGFAFARLASTPTVHTAHGRLDLAEVRRVYGHYRDQPLVSLSEEQASALPHARWVGTVPNAIDLDTLHLRTEPGDYLVFLGRISPEKRPDRAIEIARDVGVPLIMAAKVDPADRDYYEAAIAPLIARNSDLVTFLGEVDDTEKDDLLGGALAYLFPIDWPEPFGLTMAEAMATGTPVIATALGAVPRVVAHGRTGFVCATFSQMVDAVGRVGEIDRRDCRAHVERNFSPAAMATAYERVYDRVIEEDHALINGAGAALAAPMAPAGRRPPGD
jgi:glycosyltransferase involved in cell wall biosynthesis